MSTTSASSAVSSSDASSASSSSEGVTSQSSYGGGSSSAASTALSSSAANSAVIAVAPARGSKRSTRKGTAQDIPQVVRPVSQRNVDAISFEPGQYTAPSGPPASSHRSSRRAPPPQAMQNGPDPAYVYTPPPNPTADFKNDPRTDFEREYQALRMGIATNEAFVPPNERFIERQQLDPLTPEAEAKKNNSRVPWRDWWAIGLLLLTIGGIIAQLAINSSNSSIEAGSLDLHDGVYYIVGVCCVAAFLIGVAWMVMMRNCSLGMTWTMLLLPLVILAVFGALAIMESGSGAIFFFILFVIYGIYVYLVRDRVPFAAELIRVSSGLLPHYPGIYAVTFTCIFGLVAFTVLWFYSLLLLIEIDRRSDESPTGQLIFLVFAYYFIGQTFKYFMHTVTCGVVGMWYFVGGTPSMPRDPTSGALKRAITTSFGSVCFAALVVSVVKTLRFLVRAAAQRLGACAACCLNWIMGILTYLVSLFSSFALVHCALYGKKFTVAAKDTWEMFKQRGLEAIINDDLTGNVIFSGVFAAALVNGVIAYMWGLEIFMKDGQEDVTSFVITIIAAILVGLMITGCILVPMESAIQTLFVCLGENPFLMFQRDPGFMNIMAARTAQLKPVEQ